MKRHKIQHVIKKQGGNLQVIFNDGMRVFWPREYARGLVDGTTVWEHKHKNGQTVAFSWDNNLRFLVPQPLHFDESFDFVEKFRFFDRVSFNNAIIDALHYRMDKMVLPDSEKIAHNVVLLGLKSTYIHSR